jgi:two-component system CitB family response regulator
VIRVLVVEDDFRVADLHVAFTESVPGFTVVGKAFNAAQAREFLAGRRPDLVLLDVYLPDESGLDLLADIDVDTILLTAATDPATIRAARARGALTYLVKPFTREEFAERLTAYARYHAALARAVAQLSQDEIDGAIAALQPGEPPAPPKSQSAVTAHLVAEALRTAAGEPRSAAEIATELGIARATAQRYLSRLEQTGSATMALRYGSAGRPEHLYRWNGASRAG